VIEIPKAPFPNSLGFLQKSYCQMIA